MVKCVSILGSTGGVYPSKICGRGIIKKDETYVFQTAMVCTERELINKTVRAFCSDLKSNSDYIAKKIPIMPNVVNVEDVIGKAKGLSQVPLGIAGDDFNCLYHDFTQNCVLQVLVHEMNDILCFKQGIIEVVKHIPDAEVIVIDESIPDVEKEIVRLFEIAVERNNNYKRTGGNPTVDMHPIICIFQSMIKLKSVLSEDGYSKLYNILDKSQGVYNLAYFVMDDVMSVNRYCAEEWYQNQCKANGLWVGTGVEDQIRLQINRRQDIPNNKEYDESFGFYVEKGKFRILKLVTQGYEEGDK